MNISRQNSFRIAVVGAGIAGLACAAALHDAGVTLFDNSRRVGGRLATRRVNGLMFDHGAQYATSRDPAFAASMSAMVASGDAALWPASGDGRWCGVPGMSALARHMERRGVGTMRTARHAAFLHRQPDGWMVSRRAWCQSPAGSLPGHRARRLRRLVPGRVGRGSVPIRPGTGAYDGGLRPICRIGW